MPLPVIAGVPFLASVIGGLFTSIFTFVAQFVTKRVAIVAAALVLIAGLASAFYAAAMALISAISVTMPSIVVEAAGMFIPSNAVPVVSAVFAAKALRYAYDWNTKVIQMKLL